MVEAVAEDMDEKETVRPPLSMQVLPAKQQENTPGHMRDVTMIWQNSPVRRMATNIPPPLQQNRRDPKHSALLDDGVRWD